MNNGLASLTLDPGQAVTWVTREVEHAAAQDPSVRKALTLVEERVQASLADDGEMTTLSAVLWMQLRANLLELSARPSWPPLGGIAGLPAGLRAVRAGLVDGDRVLAGLEAALDTTFTPENVQLVTQQTRALANRDPQRSDRLTMLEHEVRSGADEDVIGHGPVAAGVATAVAVVAVGLLAFEIYEHHIADHPHH